MKLSCGKTAMSFAGVFLGAGFVSGQELWQFFGMHGIWGFFALLLSIGIIFILGVSVMYITTQTQITEMNRVMIPWRSLKHLCGLAGVLQLIFLFGVAAIMLAGGGALLDQLFGLPSFIGSALMCVAVFFVSVRGLSGAVRIFSCVVPLMVAIAVAAGISAVVSQNFDILPAAVKPVTATCIVSSVTYASYNVFGNLGVIVLLGGSVKDFRSARQGVLLGCALLLAIAICVLMVLTTYPVYSEFKLPMLAYSGRLSPMLEYIYGFLLLCSMFATSNSMVISISCFVCEKFKVISAHRALFSAAVCMAALILSAVGFVDLIAVIYPLFGYLGLFFIALMLVHAWLLRSKALSAHT